MKTSLPLRKIAAPLLALGFAPCLSAQVFIDFQLPEAPPSAPADIPNDFTDHFRVINAGTTFAQQFDRSGNGFLKGGTEAGAYVYDANGPAPGVSSFSVDQANPLTITFNASGQFTGASIGVYIIDTGNLASAYLGLLTVKSGNDQLRFSNGTVDPATNDTGALVAGSHPNDADFIYPEIKGDAGTIPFASSATFTYSINASNEAQFSFTVDGTTTTTYTLVGSAAFTKVEVGFRSDGEGGAMRIDDLSITGVPTPVSTRSSADEGGSTRTLEISNKEEL